MFIFICENKNYVTYDYDLKNSMECGDLEILLIHTFQFYYKSINTNDLIKDVIKNRKHEIINYNLYYLLKYYNVFKEEIKILYNLNPELFMYNLQDVEHEVYEGLNEDKDFEKEDYEKVLQDINETIIDYNKSEMKTFNFYITGKKEIENKEIKDIKLNYEIANNTKIYFIKLGDEILIEEHKEAQALRHLSDDEDDILSDIIYNNYKILHKNENNIVNENRFEF